MSSVDAAADSCAVGFLEAEGFITIFDGVERMTNSSTIRIGSIAKLGGGLVVVSVLGELAQVIEALEIGADTIRAAHGVPATSIAFANPTPLIRRLALGLGAIG